MLEEILPWGKVQGWYAKTNNFNFRKDGKLYRWIKWKLDYYDAMITRLKKLTFYCCKRVSFVAVYVQMKATDNCFGIKYFVGPV